MASQNRRSPGRPVYIVDGARSPFLKARGKPGPFKAAELAVQAARPLLLRQPFSATDFDEVILGCVSPGPDEANIGRVVALRLGCGERVPAWTVQRNCASGMQSLDSAFHNIAHGYSDLVLAGGVESMSNSPILLRDDMVSWLADWNRARSLGQKLKTLGRLRPKQLAPVIGLLRGLTDPVVGLSMGQTAEELAHRFGITREQMDAFSMESHQRVAKAQDERHFDEIEVLYDTRGNCYEQDDGVRRDSNAEQLAKLKPVFDRPFGNITAGNSAQVTDGAAWLILASEKAVKEHELPVLARIIDSEWAALDPGQMGLGPAHAIAPLMKRRRLKLDGVDYWEINEAFAAQVIAVVEALKNKDYCKNEIGVSSEIGEIPHERLNVDGGGISLGHPVGASGARIVLHLLKVLERENGHRGIASLCIGGGQGGAMLIEREVA
jgi:acetyl-CoA C-acetyltransferase